MSFENNSTNIVYLFAFILGLVGIGLILTRFYNIKIPFISSDMDIFIFLSVLGFIMCTLVMGKGIEKYGWFDPFVFISSILGVLIVILIGVVLLNISTPWNLNEHNGLILLIILTALSMEICGNDRPKNIILFIGDGMGPAQVSAHVLNKGNTSFNSFEYVGMVTNHASDNLITDSGAAATALATGYKSYNGAVSISPKGDTLKTLYEYARDRAMWTGLIATSTITHATPACFAAHVEDRDDQNEIARQIAEFAPEVLIGGGLMYFLPGFAEGGDLLINVAVRNQPTANKFIICCPSL